MIKKINKFYNKIFGAINVFKIGDEIYFLGTEVAKILGYKKPGNALSEHVHYTDKKRLSPKDVSSEIEELIWGENKANDFAKKDKILISESGLYCLIFSSKLESAIDFKLWVTREVLPSIRQNGGYIAGQEEDESLKAKIRELRDDNKRLQKRRHELISEKEDLKAKAKKAETNISSLNEVCSLYEEMIENLLADCREYQAKIKSLKGEDICDTECDDEIESIPRVADTAIRVDASGFVIF